MKVAIDSSVLIAAYISEEGVCAQLLEEVLMHHELIASSFIVEEVARKLTEKFKFSTTVVANIKESISASAKLVAPSDVPRDVCRDQNDLAVLGTAVAGQAELLITADNDLLVIGIYQGIAIVKPGEFLRSFAR